MLCDIKVKTLLSNEMVRFHSLNASFYLISSHALIFKFSVFFLSKKMFKLKTFTSLVVYISWLRCCNRAFWHTLWQGRQNVRFFPLLAENDGVLASSNGVWQWAMLDWLWQSSTTYFSSHNFYFFVDIPCPNRSLYTQKRTKKDVYNKHIQLLAHSHVHRYIYHHNF